MKKKICINYKPQNSKFLGLICENLRDCVGVGVWVDAPHFPKKSRSRFSFKSNTQATATGNPKFKNGK